MGKQGLIETECLQPEQSFEGEFETAYPVYSHEWLDTSDCCSPRHDDHRWIPQMDSCRNGTVMF